jgi:hypothetical protein
MGESEILPSAPVPLNEHYIKRELDLREREVAAREREITAKEAEIKKSPWLNPLVIGVFVAAIGLIGNFVVAAENNRNTQTVERFRAQSNLVIEAIKADQQTACNNLVFFVKLRLIDDTEKAIRQVCVNQPQQAPSLGRTDFTSGPIPPLVKVGAPVGTKYQSKYTKGDLECINETVKVSTAGWQERTASSDSPAGCHVDAVVFQYTERESNDPQYLLLFDEGRSLFARLPNIAVGQTGPSDWRLASNQTWNAGRSVTRVN